MDNLFGWIEGRLSISVTDATMMWIVHYAMDRAHGKVKSKEGVIERLNEISKFYELAVIQLEGCMKFVQEEADINILGNGHEKVLLDLVEIRDRLQGRLQDSELALRDKDRELRERFENELKLKQALEVKERELVSLRNANLDLERTKNDDAPEFSLSSPVSDKDGEICELMHSVDQQVLNIEKKLEPEPDCSIIDEETNGGIDNKKIEQMGYDINILKETLHQAFGKMQNAIFLSQLGPQEQQLRWTIENDAICTLINGFVKDLKENFEMEMRNQENQVFTGFSEQLSDLMTEITFLSDELENLINHNEVQSKAVKGYENSASSTKTNLEFKIPPRARRSLSEGDRFANLNIFSSNVGEMETKQLLEDEPEEGGDHSVAKIIKNHESIVRKKSDEIKWLKSEIVSKKGSSTFRREKDLLYLKKRIQEVILRLNNIINSNARLVDTFREYGGDQDEEISPVKNEVMPAIDSLEDVWKKINKSSVSNTINEEVKNDIRMLKEDIETKRVETKMREEILFTVCSQAVKDFYSALDWELECFQYVCSLREDACKVIFREMHKEWNENIENYSIERLIMEEISFLLFDEIMKDIVNTASYRLRKLQEVKTYDNLIDGPSPEIAEYSVKENVCLVYFSEVIDEWKEEIDACHIENLIREEINHLILVEAVKDACLRFRETESQKQEKTSWEKIDGSLGGRGEEIFVEKLDNLIECLEKEEDLVPSTSSEVNENNAEFDLVALDQEQLSQELMDKDESAFTAVRSKLEKAPEQLAMSKTIMRELNSILGTVDGDQGRVPEQMSSADIKQERNFIISQQLNEEIHANQSDFMFIPLQEFSQVFENFELQAQQKLQNNVFRLEDVKHQLNLLIEFIDSVRKRKLLYKTAFIRRSQNLQKAEHEVDLLADQVDVLMGLLEKIYMTLHKHAPVFQQHFDVSEILKLIQKELIGEVQASSK